SLLSSYISFPFSANRDVKHRSLLQLAELQLIASTQESETSPPPRTPSFRLLSPTGDQPASTVAVPASQHDSSISLVSRATDASAELCSRRPAEEFRSSEPLAPASGEHVCVEAIGAQSILALLCPEAGSSSAGGALLPLLMGPSDATQAPLLPRRGRPTSPGATATRLPHSSDVFTASTGRRPNVNLTRIHDNLAAASRPAQGDALSDEAGLLATRGSTGLSEKELGSNDARQSALPRPTGVQSGAHLTFVARQFPADIVDR
ncbi:unnamed protein product, partial [Protopolystoma xenopodis]